MFPLKDNIPSRTRPVVNWLMIILCAIVFFKQLGSERANGGVMVEQFGMIPARVLHPGERVQVQEIIRVNDYGDIRDVVRSRVATPSPIPPLFTLLTCIFLHGGWLHFLGNMWFLIIFGDNVEDRLGHFGYLLFYLAGGVAASFVHLVTNPGSQLPTVGASGAISAVMGAYLILYPRAKVLTAVPIFVFIQMMVIPAPLFIGVWFLFQFVQGYAAIGGVESGGVAWWAHIGGFAAGVAIILFLRGKKWLKPEPAQPLPFGSRRYGLGGR